MIINGDFPPEFVYRREHRLYMKKNKNIEFCIGIKAFLEEKGVLESLTIFRPKTLLHQQWWPFCQKHLKQNKTQ